MSKWYEVFRAGSYPQGNFSENDLQEVVDNYDPQQHEAPVVVGHPQKEDPAFGWVEAVKQEGGKLLARFKQIVPEFAEAVNQGRYKKVSVRLRKKDNGWNLIHVGFLGAAKPQVEGLESIQFSPEEEEGISLECDFSRREENVMPNVDEAQIREQIRQEIEAEFSEERQKFSQELADTKKRLKETEMRGFIDENKKKLPPAVRTGLVEFMASLPEEVTVEFDEEEGKKAKKSPLEFFKDFIAKLPEQADFGEVGKGDEGKPADTKDFDAEGQQVDEESAELHRKAVEFAEKNNVSYEDAVLAVSK